MYWLADHATKPDIRINSIAPHVTNTAAVRRLPTLVPDLLRVGIPVSSVEETGKYHSLLGLSYILHPCSRLLLPPLKPLLHNHY
jgi:hypothetical protein